MVFIIFILSMLLLAFNVCGLIFWSVHISQVKDFTSKYGWSNFSIFMREFNKTEWKKHEFFKNSFFSADKKSEIDEDVIKFNNIGMMLDYISYLRFCWFISRQHIKKENYIWI